MSVPAGTVYGPDISNHNSAVDFAELDALSDVHLVTHKITEGVGWTDPTVAGRAPSLQRFAAAGFYHVLWPTNSQDNPTNQAQWFVDEVIRLAPWMLAHPCPVLQGDFELFSNFVPYRAPTIAECNAWGDEVLRLWTAKGGNPPAQVDYAPYWLYGSAVTGLKHLWWASSYVAGSGQYRPLYPGNGDSRWTQVPGKPADILQYSSSASFGAGTTSVDANGIRGVATAQDLQNFLLGGDMSLTDDEIARIWNYQLPAAQSGGVTAAQRLAHTDFVTGRLTSATSDNVWDENIPNADGTVVAPAKTRLADIARDSSIDLPAQITGILDSLTSQNATLAQQMVGMAGQLAQLSEDVKNLQLGAPVKYMMTGELSPESPAPPAQSPATPLPGA